MSCRGYSFSFCLRCCLLPSLGLLSQSRRIYYTGVCLPACAAIPNIFLSGRYAVETNPYLRLMLHRNPPPKAGHCGITVMTCLPTVVVFILQMAQQVEPLYDFPEPTQPLGQKFVGHQRSQGSLKSISVLDRLLLTVPVWFQLSINPATALHILQREPPGVRATHTHTHTPLKLGWTFPTDSQMYFVSNRPSWCANLAHLRGMCCVYVWPMIACRPLCSSLGSGRSNPVRTLFCARLQMRSNPISNWIFRLKIVIKIRLSVE